MSYASAKITMKSGDAHYTTASADQVVAAVQRALSAVTASPSLISFELPRVPTGQLFYVAPEQVESVVPEARW